MLECFLVGVGGGLEGGGKVHGSAEGRERETDR